MKKADLSLTTIVVAALVLVVLIVLIAVFGGKMRLFGKNYDDTSDNTKSQVCEANNGFCASGPSCPNGNPAIASIKSWIDCGANPCCQK